jgi:AraC family transcriptional regulator, transcriptional activator of pobA
MGNKARAERDDEGNFYDPRSGGEAVRVRSLHLGCEPCEPARTNYFCVYWIESGSGEFFADTSRHSFGPESLLFAAPYQYIRFVPKRDVCGAVVEFHANFLCVETFHAEVGCSSALFNDPYGVPLVTLNDRAKTEVKEVIDHIRREQDERELAFNEVVLAYLKVLLVLAARLKSRKAGSCGEAGDPRHPLLGKLRELIEQNYRSKHLPAEYARLLHMTPKTLGRVVREHLGTTLTDLVRSRILIHAKWQLLHTLKPVKEVSRELGFGDELYFSRLFKKTTGVSPTFFREFETKIRGGSNLSMPSGDAPILLPAKASDTTTDIAASKPGRTGK